jgi:argininosuccinate lyase
VTQNPMDSLKRRTPPVRRTFPNPQYESEVLLPFAGAADLLLFDAAACVHKARVLDLLEMRTIKKDAGYAALRALMEVSIPAETGHRPLAHIDAVLSETAGGEALLGSAPEEIVAASARIVLRRGLLEYLSSVLSLRGAIADLALSHLTTLITLTSNGQMVQPTTLGHYLTGQIGPLSRGTQRLVEAYSRLNRSPLGAVSGVSTAIPVRRERLAELLGFDGVDEHTLDALAAADVEYEIMSTLAGMSLEAMRFVTDLGTWARDDTGTIAPANEFVHADSSQPQRRDPLVLDHLRVRLADQVSAATGYAMGLSGGAMIPGMAMRMESCLKLERQLSAATVTFQLLTQVLNSLEVNRALTANRAHKGFATSSELADLLTVDEGLSRTEAYHLAERIATEATILALGGMTLDTKLVDKLALEVIGREIGIETETLGKCLSVKRFVERREVTGGPAPASVRDMIEREKLSLRRDNAWINDRADHVHASDTQVDTLVRDLIG